MEVIEEKFVTNSEAKNILDDGVDKDEEEREYEQKIAIEHLKKYSKIDAKKVEKLKESLVEVDGLSEEQIVAIADILPKDRDDLRVILSKGRFNLDDTSANQILEIVSDNA